MNNILTGIFSKISGSALSTAVGGRVFTDEAPDGTQFPYLVLSIVSDNPDENFTDSFEEVVIQFSLYSISQGMTEITGLYGNLKSLFDNTVLTVSGSTFLHSTRKSLNTMTDEMALPDGTQILRHWAVEYELLTEN